MNSYDIIMAQEAGRDNSTDSWDILGPLCMRAWGRVSWGHSTSQRLSEIIALANLLLGSGRVGPLFYDLELQCRDLLV